jgi:hypothetical protein
MRRRGKQVIKNSLAAGTETMIQPIELRLILGQSVRQSLRLFCWGSPHNDRTALSPARQRFKPHNKEKKEFLTKNSSRKNVISPHSTALNHDDCSTSINY